MSDEQNEHPIDPRKLQDMKYRAITALVGGATMEAAAEMAGVSRSTISRWHHDAKFVAVLNKAKSEQRTALQGEIRTMAQTAVKTLRAVLEAEHGSPVLRIRIALGVLKAVGALEAEQLGPTNPLEVEREWAERVNAITAPLDPKIKRRP